ncbi:MAG: S9 family peptidase [Gemmatimonadetes bacterium]|nr:S9 family peptidase [Gemmatimonadota bacterium]
MRSVLSLLAIGAFVSPVAAQEAYKRPPAVVEKILDAPRLPSLVASPDGRMFVLAQPVPVPSIADVSQPMLRLAGLRINPNTSGPHLPVGFRGLVLRDAATGAERVVKTPAGARLQLPRWSPDGRWVSFTSTTNEGIDLWIVNPVTAEARALTGRNLDAVTGEACQWHPRSTELLCKFIPAGRGALPKEPAAPIGPIVQRNEGKPTPAPTFEDLLASPYDETLFEYFATVQLARVDPATGKRTDIGSPAIYRDISFAPPGQAILVSRVNRPFSYHVPLGSFAQDIEVWSLIGDARHTVAKVAAAEDVPIGGVRTGPRNVRWKPAEPATLVWVEALDGGMTRRKADVRDKVVESAQPFAQQKEVARLAFRYGGTAYGRNGLTLVSESDRTTRMTRTWLLKPGADKTVLFERSSEDRYGDPGSPVQTRDASGDAVLLQSTDGNSIYLSGPGASPQGDRPFLDRRNLATGKTDRLWQSGTDVYETLSTVLDADARRIVVQQESRSMPDNYAVRDLVAKTVTPVTKIAPPIPELATVKREIVKYKRNDGLELSGTLYYPTDYKEGQKVPTIFWVYPAEFASASAAAQVRGSDNTFLWPTGASQMFLLTQGYAVLDNPSLPVVGGDSANNTYVEQTVAGAKAAVDFLVQKGMSDGNFGVGGHSYGGFTTANLLAHSDLFKAGVARSGAYNRTLTPFGFQNEQRLYWEAPEVYLNMMPFQVANKINEPIMLIHGMADDNTGTFPVQSERMYAALKGLGATVDYIQLPNEAHGYLARESVGDVVARMIEWYDKHVKPARKTT